ncbi:MAG: methyltransferase domain-containing protein [Ottowia sp.]
MTMPSSALHVYDREIHGSERTSLSVLSAHIPPGARVLDLGCGSGAVGRFLTRRGDGAVIDGLTLNTEEAALAAPDYRRVEVANLDSADLAALFAGSQYDAIVCADVLEHTRHPQQVLASARRLLAEGGRVLISIPNAGYCGLIAELMAGEFRYRPEGLLDETHLRFFTRRALTRFLAENGWAIDSLETIHRALPESEFRAAFDALPAPVARHLLALPDALTYQFIVVARAAAPGERVEPPPAEPLLPAQALFSSELYLGQPGGGFAEEHKLRAAGVMGQPQQTLRFELPAGEPPTGLKFDPADRPGFFYLHAITLRSASGEPLWQWDSRNALPLLQAKRSGMALQPPATPQGALVALLLDDDPWMELPIPPDALALAAGGALEVQAGWPMSADWLALAGAAQHEIADAREQTESERAARQLDHAAFSSQHAEWERQMHERASALHAAEAHGRELARQVAALEQQNDSLREQGKTLLERASVLTRENDDARRLLRDIENSTVFRATRPIVRQDVHRPPAGHRLVSLVA